MNRKNGPIWLVLILLLTSLFLSFYKVDETRQGVVLQMGEPVGKALKPGFHLRVPFLQKVIFYDGRLLHFNGPTVDVLTSDQKELSAKPYAVWRITDPLKFHVAIGGREEAVDRLGDVILSEIRTEIGRRNLDEVISEGRAEMMTLVTKKAASSVKSFGITLVEVGLKRLDLPLENEPAVYQRMQSERNRQARKLLAEGREEAAGIEAGAERKASLIVAEAELKAQKIKALADAEAARMYSEAYAKDPDFYDFVRTLELYRAALDERASLFLSRDDDLMELIRSGRQARPGPVRD